MNTPPPIPQQNMAMQYMSPIRATPETTIHYQFEAKVLKKIWLEQVFSKRFWLRRMIALVVIAICYWTDHHFLALLIIVLVIMFPLTMYIGLSSILRKQSEFTDICTLSYSAQGLVQFGRDYLRQSAWSKFNRFTEDNLNFYLKGYEAIPKVIPKSAFTAAQLDEFRKYALAGIKTTESPASLPNL